MQLYIGNKNYSSWSMRPWVLMTQAGIDFDEVLLRFDAFTAESRFKREARKVNPAGRVPVLVDDGFAVWDTLAIAEYLAEKYPDMQLWPTQRLARARARSLCAEMHSGFGALRSHCPMNVEAPLAEVGARLMREQPALQRDLARMVQMWETQLREHGGPFLFGDFCIADAFFAPVCVRITAYGLPVSDVAAAYVERIYALPAMRRWVEEALAEHDFLDYDEPYRKASATQ